MAAPSADPRRALLLGGETGRDLLAVDWDATSLGPPERWPQSLLSVVQVVLTSRFAMWMAWGPELTFFCNEAYRRDTLGPRYPWALGRPTQEVWAEIWPDIGPRIEAVMGTGVATWDEGLLLFLERNGYPEETYHTFSYSPLTGDDGAIEGMLCVVSEDTEGVVGERRMTTLRDLGAELAGVQDEVTQLAAAGRCLAANRHDLPFALAYLLEGEGETAHLGFAAGIEPGHVAAPSTLTPGSGPWPLEPLDGPRLVELNGRFGDLPSGAWDTPPSQALLVPVPQAGAPMAYGLLVVGLNPHRPADDGYAAFLGLVAGQLAAAIAGARSYAAERHRAEQLAEIDQAKTQFFTNVSHELRTPLTLLVGPAEDALADVQAPLPDPQRHRVEVISRNGARLLKLVNTLLDFSRLEAGGTRARFEPLALDRVTAEVASMFESAVRTAGLQLVVDCPPLPAPVHADREAWTKIVLNLVSNALKFTFEGAIHVRLAARERTVRLTVTDTGVGVPEAEQARLFERFHRVPGARSRSYEGSGIGLALVAELAHLHGGAVSVTSAPGEGSTFTVEVPFGTAHLPADAVTEAASSASSVPPQARGFVEEALRWLDAGGAGDATGAVRGERPRVLVVDDNADMRGYMAELLEADYVVETAPNGAVALEQARREPPDLVLTDVMMPELDGFGLLAALQEDPATAQVPVVMVSARAGEEGTVEGLEAGADDYLVKPFSARELLARVKANLELDRARRNTEALERTQALVDQAQRLAGVGSWEIDLATGAMLASEEFARQLHLTAEELAGDGLQRALSERLLPEDLPHVQAALGAAAETGASIDYEARIVHPQTGEVRVYRSIGEVERDADGSPRRLRGSNQDITEQRAAERATAAAAAEREAAARERQIADELQRSLLPEEAPLADQLEVATSYQAGAADTQVGGDWYDVIEIGAGRTALVLGDVMGRGVQAAAIMGQLRAAVRAYARLDLPPADLLESLDGIVRDIDAEHIATCVYAVYDANHRTLVHANAGHLPPLLLPPGGPAVRLDAVSGPPLGSGPMQLTEQRVALEPGSLLALYTDGLVERRDRVLDVGIDALARALEASPAAVGEIPARLKAALVPDGSDDDIALLVARITPEPQRVAATLAIPDDPQAIQTARSFTTRALDGLDPRVVGDAVLLVSEMVTNAMLHGQAPIELHLRRVDGDLLIEVEDGATAIPRKRRPGPHDEHGRGLQLVAAIASRWGIRPTGGGKAVWALMRA